MTTLSTMGQYSKKVAMYKPGKGLSPDTKSSGTFNLRSPISRTVKSKYLLCKPLSQWKFIMAFQDN